LISAATLLLLKKIQIVEKKNGRGSANLKN